MAGKGKVRARAKALTAAYAALEAELEQRVDASFGEGSYQKAVGRLTTVHLAKWFSPWITGERPGLPDPLGREERLVELAAPWIREPAVALIEGTGAVAGTLGVSKIIAPPGPMRDLACSLYGLEALADDISGVAFDEFATVLCIDVLQSRAQRGGVVEFLASVTAGLGAKSSLVIADTLSFQDDAVENLVALDFEITDLKSLGSHRLFALNARR